MATSLLGWKVLYLCSAIKSTASGKRLTPVPWDTVNDITQEQRGLDCTLFSMPPKLRVRQRAVQQSFFLERKADRLTDA